MKTSTRSPFSWLTVRLLLSASMLVIAAGFAGSKVDAAQRDGRKPLNVLMIVADDLGWSDLSCYGTDLHESPQLDELATRGVRFTNAYSSAAICSPTRAALMTGKSPARLRMTIWHEYAATPPQDRKMIPPVVRGNLPLEETTIADVLHEQGYLTAHVGKWHLGDAAHFPENQGFDINIGGTMWGAPTTFFYPYSGLFGSEMEPRYVPDLELGDADEYLTDRLTDEAIRIIEHAGGKPFYLNMWYHTVHTPIEAKEEDIAYFRQKLKPGMHHQNPTYAAMVRSLDQNVGRLLDKLDELSLSENTLVVFTSDNGGFINNYREMPMVTSNYPLRSGKGSLYEGGVRIPLIVRGPGVVSDGQLCEEPVDSTDFYPTVLEMTGIEGNAEHNAKVDGMSLTGLFDDPQSTLERDTLYFHYPHYYRTTTPVGAIRSGDWKLLEYFEDGRLELFNLADDLSESNNLADAMPDKARDLVNKLRAWRANLNAQMPVPNPNPNR